MEDNDMTKKTLLVGTHEMGIGKTIQDIANEDRDMVFSLTPRGSVGPISKTDFVYESIPVIPSNYMLPTRFDYSSKITGMNFPKHEKSCLKGKQKRKAKKKNRKKR
jgi:hypothetical protein